MLYPKKIKVKKKETIVKCMILISFFIGILLVVINHLTTPHIPWAGLANAGIIYIWVTVIYSMNRNINIAAHVMIQTIAVSMLSYYIDYRFGMKGWSIDLAIPIIVMIANATMLLLTLVSHRKYIRYTMYQLGILLFSLLPFYFWYQQMTHQPILGFIASGISVLNLILTLALCAKDIKETIIRKFHM